MAPVTIDAVASALLEAYQETIDTDIRTNEKSIDDLKHVNGFSTPLIKCLKENYRNCINKISHLMNIQSQTVMIYNKVLLNYLQHPHKRRLERLLDPKNMEDLHMLIPLREEFLNLQDTYLWLENGAKIGFLNAELWNGLLTAGYEEIPTLRDSTTPKINKISLEFFEHIIPKIDAAIRKDGFRPDAFINVGMSPDGKKEGVICDHYGPGIILLTYEVNHTISFSALSNLEQVHPKDSICLRPYDFFSVISQESGIVDISNNYVIFFEGNIVDNYSPRVFLNSLLRLHKPMYVVIETLRAGSDSYEKELYLSGEMEKTIVQTAAAKQGFPMDAIRQGKLDVLVKNASINQKLINGERIVLDNVKTILPVLKFDKKELSFFSYSDISHACPSTRYDYWNIIQTRKNMYPIMHVRGPSNIEYTVFRIDPLGDTPKLVHHIS